MMTNVYFAKQIAKLEYAFRKWKLMDDVVAMRLWYKIFKNEDMEVFSNAIDNYIFTNKFDPTVAGIKEEMISYAIGDDNSDEEFEKIMSLVRSSGNQATREQLLAIPKKSKKILDSMGGYRSLCLTESTQIQYYKSKFVKSYKESQGSINKKIMIECNLNKLMIEQKDE